MNYLIILKNVLLSLIYQMALHPGLGVFAKTLDAYLIGIGADLHLNKFSEEELNNQQIPSPIV